VKRQYLWEMYCNQWCSGLDSQWKSLNLCMSVDDHRSVLRDGCTFSKELIYHVLEHYYFCSIISSLNVGLVPHECLSSPILRSYMFGSCMVQVAVLIADLAGIETYRSQHRRSVSGDRKTLQKKLKKILKKSWQILKNIDNQYLCNMFKTYHLAQ